jgi:hypothetical protein
MALVRQPASAIGEAHLATPAAPIALSANGSRVEMSWYRSTAALCDERAIKADSAGDRTRRGDPALPPAGGQCIDALGGHA